MPCRAYTIKYAARLSIADYFNISSLNSRCTCCFCRPMAMACVGLGTTVWTERCFAIEMKNRNVGTEWPWASSLLRCNAFVTVHTKRQSIIYEEIALTFSDIFIRGDPQNTNLLEKKSRCIIATRRCIDLAIEWNERVDLSPTNVEGYANRRQTII